ncbi:MAG: DUF2808 domain-containing protein [Nodosilinea sp.]
MIFLTRGFKLAVLGLVTTAITAGLGVVLPPQVSQAQTGLTIFGGVDPAYRLAYFIDSNKPRSNNARYYLQVSRNRLPRDVISLQIEYPESFTEQQGSFNPNRIELRLGDWRGGEVIPVKSVTWQEESRRIEIIPEAPITANTSFVIVMQDVRNPRRYGYHYFNLRMMYQGDVIDQYAGTWPLELGAGD